MNSIRTICKSAANNIYRNFYKEDFSTNEYSCSALIRSLRNNGIGYGEIADIIGEYNKLLRPKKFAKRKRLYQDEFWMGKGTDKDRADQRMLMLLLFAEVMQDEKK